MTGGGVEPAGGCNKNDTALDNLPGGFCAAGAVGRVVVAVGVVTVAGAVEATGAAAAGIVAVVGAVGANTTGAGAGVVAVVGAVGAETTGASTAGSAAGNFTAPAGATRIGSRVCEEGSCARAAHGATVKRKPTRVCFHTRVMSFFISFPPQTRL